VTTSDGVAVMPVAARRALARQRLHALVVGQHHDEQFLTINGELVSDV
jgi:hypothetical protein